MFSMNVTESKLHRVEKKNGVILAEKNALHREKKPVETILHMSNVEWYEIYP